MFNKILVAVNNTEIGQQVFEEALTLTSSNNAKLLLLHVISPFDDDYLAASRMQTDEAYTNFHTHGVEYYMRQWEALKQKGIEFLTLLTNRAIAKDINAEFTQEVGDPSRLICEMARTWKADLIIMGRRGRSGLSEFFLGSVSNYVLHNAPCSVLTVQGAIPTTKNTLMTASTVSSV
ncbi:universal stress protein [Halotia branconii]|uniref:Universal stress protein n=1 Tax=Halotia branconii CENA392 TaxID=1539056 RepID=A0AAJ6NNV3_9CYAN|nr:universal stress protein [Halotia branconii]WGV23857.1 universal stress protein [Halotia branconii CENA392]